MSFTAGDERVVHVPLFEAFAARMSDEAPQYGWREPVAWSTALRRTADLVAPDIIALTCDDALRADVDFDTPVDIDQLGLADGLGEATEGFVETLEIIADTRDERTVALLPSPVTICLEHFSDAWLDALETDEFAALDALHEVSQLLTDLIRAFGGFVDGVILNWRTLTSALEHGLTVDDAFLETGAVFNVATHHELPVCGRFQRDASEYVIGADSEFDTVVFDEVPRDELDMLSDARVQTGCGFPQVLWEEDGDAFRDAVADYLAALPSASLLMPTIPASVDPERIQVYKELVAAH